MNTRPQSHRHRILPSIRPFLPMLCLMVLAKESQHQGLSRVPRNRLNECDCDCDSDSSDTDSSSSHYLSSSSDSSCLSSSPSCFALGLQHFTSTVTFILSVKENVASLIHDIYSHSHVLDNFHNNNIVFVFDLK